MTLLSERTWTHCSFCEAELTSEDVLWEPTMCCNGQECGCMGMPLAPPICNKCIKENNDGTKTK